MGTHERIIYIVSTNTFKHFGSETVLRKILLKQWLSPRQKKYMFIPHKILHTISGPSWAHETHLWISYQ